LRQWFLSRARILAEAYANLQQRGEAEAPRYVPPKPRQEWRLPEPEPEPQPRGLDTMPARPIAPIDWASFAAKFSRM
jgi:hypothetical protein